MLDHKNSAYLRQIRHELLSRLRTGYRGLCLWSRLRRNVDKNQTAIVLIPRGDAEISFFALAYLDQMLRTRGLKNAIIATNDQAVVRNCTLYAKYIAEVKQLSAKEIEELLQLYCLYRFDENFIVASLNCPQGRKGTSLAGVKGISKEEIFAVGVYGLFPFLQADDSAFKG